MRNKNELQKRTKTVVPLGVRIGKLDDDEIITLDVIFDDEDGKHYIESSFAFSTKQALNLGQGLMAAAGKENVSD